jgi:beta-carotene ketolase (CrtW type)
MLKQFYQKPMPVKVSRKLSIIHKHGSNMYKPNEFKNIIVSTSVITVWATLFHEAMFVDINSLEGIVLVPCITFMYTGLFITGHDAMHGNITNNQYINDAFGHICTNLYAGLDFNKMRHKHMQHHIHTGQIYKDPDFHKGDLNMFKWFFSFMKEYTDIFQFLKLSIVVESFMQLGVPYENLCIYMAACGILSSLQLFYFGTFIPHRPLNNNEVMNWEKSKSSSKDKLNSFLTCYHFDCHFEHHAMPHVPWFELWNVKQKIDI